LLSFLRLFYDPTTQLGSLNKLPMASALHKERNHGRMN
jgi:hypothetical protein